MILIETDPPKTTLALFGVQVPEEVTKIEVWGTSFKDPGPDYCEVRLFVEGEIYNTVRIEGY